MPRSLILRFRHLLACGASVGVLVDDCEAPVEAISP
jgi:hypothetical protein